jgi:hypothetical protein
MVLANLSLQQSTIGLASEEEADTQDEDAGQLENILAKLSLQQSVISLANEKDTNTQEEDEMAIRDQVM